jgi:osmotically-inducible protein OsmY
MKVVFFPVKVTTRSLRWVGLRRLVLIGLGATLALMITPVTGSELRRRLSRLVARRVPDADLAARVRHELSHSPRTWHLPQPSISVLQGRVVLAGQAPHATGRADLERVVAAVPGVVAVDNEIIVA